MYAIMLKTDSRAYLIIMHFVFYGFKFLYHLNEFICAFNSMSLQALLNTYLETFGINTFFCFFLFCCLLLTEDNSFDIVD